MSRRATTDWMEGYSLGGLVLSCGPGFLTIAATAVNESGRLWLLRATTACYYALIECCTEARCQTRATARLCGADRTD